MSTGPAPALLPGGPLELPGRGTSFVRHQPAPPGAPTVLLLHGLGATADANWFPAYPALAERYGVVAIDHRGHGRGIRGAPRMALADLADDAAAALDVLGVSPVIAVGYSMGGPVAQLLWHRHRAKVAGLVLCATAHRFRGLEPFRDLGPAVARRIQAAAARRRRPQLPSGVGRWVAAELRRTDRRAAVMAGIALSRYDAEPWIGQIDVPHAVVVTTEDATVTPARQRRLAEALPDPIVVEAAIEHTGCVTRPERFVPALLTALDGLMSVPTP